MTHACNCMYGPQDVRCCISRARRAALEEAHRLGAEGKPLPPEKTAWDGLNIMICPPNPLLDGVSDEV